MNANIDWTTRKYRDIVMVISADAQQKDAGTGYTITVRFDFTALTEAQIIDLLFDSSSLRVKFQNHHRPKGREHLKALSKLEFVPWTVNPSGTKVKTVLVRAMTPAEMLEYLKANPAEAAKFLAAAQAAEPVAEETEE